MLSYINLRSSFSWASFSKSSGSSSISGSGGDSYPSSSAGRGGLNPLFKSLLRFLESFSFLIRDTNSYFKFIKSSLYLSTNSLIYVLIPDPFYPKIIILGGGGNKGTVDGPSFPGRNLDGLNLNSSYSFSPTNTNVFP